MQFAKRFWQKLISPKIPTSPPSPTLVVVEGNNDIDFLRRISLILALDDPKVTNLTELERSGRIMFVPVGGGDSFWSWAVRLAKLDCPEFHLYDREISPSTEIRQQTVDLLNQRPRRRALLTAKRNLENYLHPLAIFEAGGVAIAFGDFDDVGTLLSQQKFAVSDPGVDWSQLPPSARKKRRYRIKRWLNTLAVERMTASQLAERDPAGEVRQWLATIAALVNGAL